MSTDQLHTIDSVVTGFNIFDKNLTIERAVNGRKIPIRHLLAEPDHYTGPGEFTYVVNLQDLIPGAGLRDSDVPLEDRWNNHNSPPAGVKVLEFNDHRVEGHLSDISMYASSKDWHDLSSARFYRWHCQQVYDAIVTETGIDPRSVVVLGLLRAGGVAGEMLGIPLKDQVLIETKRLRLKEGHGGNMAIGIEYVKQSDLARLDGQHLLFPDPAGATFASILANLQLLLTKGIRPAKVSIWNVSASQQGIEFAFRATKEMGIVAEIVTGGCVYRLNEKYYLVRKDGRPAVGDAGDWLSTS
jgi:uracil phosphoribosyltransferase